MKKCFALCLSVLLLALSLTGCAPELYERILISAIGVDLTENGYRVTARAAVAQEDGSEICLSGEGKTVPEALNQLAFSSGQKPLYSHNTLVVFGMDCAKSGLNRCMDFFIRHYDSRPTVNVFLSETTAEEILMQEGGTPSKQIANLAKSADYSGLSLDVNLIELINGIYGDGWSAALPVLKMEDSAMLSGTAVLDYYRLQCVLTPEETRGLLALRGLLKAGETAVVDPECGDVSLSVHNTTCSIRFTGTAENPRFDVALQIEGEISSISGEERHLENQAFPRLERAFAERTLADVSAYLSAAVFQNGCDAAGFGNVILRDAPEVWRGISESWTERLPEAAFDLHVEAVIERVEEEDTPYL